MTALPGIPMLRGRLYLPQQIKRLQISIDETPVMRAWKKLMLATGLSAERDLIKQYNDDSLNLVACVLLDKAAQEQLGGAKICRQIFELNNLQGANQYVADGEVRRFFAGAEFDSPDFAPRFAAERLPGIVAAAPKLPFQIITVVGATVSSYDRATGRFKVTSDYGPDGSFYGPGASFNVLGSPTDLVLKNLTWPASEQEARAFAASQAGSSSYHAFVAIP